MYLSNFETHGFIMETKTMNQFLKDGLDYCFHKNDLSSEDLSLFDKFTSNYKDAIQIFNNVDNVLRKISGYSSKLFRALQEWKFIVADNHERALAA